MEFVCHRCSATLDPDAFYCQNCGAPQIRFVPQEENPESANGEATGRASFSLDAEHSGPIDWKLAIQIATLVALGVGILSTLLAAASVLWVVWERSSRSESITGATRRRLWAGRPARV